MNRTIDSLGQSKDQRGNTLNRDMIRTIGTLTIVAACLGSCRSMNDNRRATLLLSSNDRLMDLFFLELSSPSHEQLGIDSFLELLAHCMVLPNPRKDVDLAVEHRCMSSIASRITGLIQTRKANMEPDPFGRDDDSDDGMDIDLDDESQATNLGRQPETTYYPRRLVQSTYHPATQRMSITAYATLMQHLQPSEDNTDADQIALGKLTAFLVRLTPSDLLACRPMISAVYDHVGHFNPEDTSKLISRILDEPLRSYDHERSETTHALTMEIMLGEIEQWTDPGNSVLYEDALELYSWLTRTALPAGILSNSVQRKFSAVLLQLLSIDPEYGHSGELPSSRTTLFSMLQNSNLEVGHYLSKHISSIFNLYTLAKHDEVFDDLNSSLPTDVEWAEGIALRLLALAHLASSWPSLLRRCIYGVFDTAGQIASSTSYATRCISYTSQSLGLSSSEDLFRLFAPQLLFTWLDFSRPIANVPFSIFGYGTLLELVEQNMAEVYAQLVIRGHFDGIAWLVDVLHTTEERVFRAAFPKAVAYAMSWDIAVGDKDHQNVCESHLRQLMKSSTEYRSLVVANFPQVVAQMFISLDQDGLVEKALEKKPSYSYVSDALKDIKSYSSSDRALPSTQQPHFKAKYLPDQMERAARRTSSSQEVMTIVQDLTPPVLTTILRSLLDEIHPALGSLHACQIVRKLRLLVAFAGVNAVQGYPLELLLRTLRPLAVDSHCADDVLGILYYLFDRGLTYLKTNIPVLTSTALLILLSMKSFVVSRQDNTTQESQFRSTVSKMQSFHDWLVQYLLGCRDAFIVKDDEQKKAVFSALVQACRGFSLPASADKRNPSSILLQALMDDEQSKTPVLRKTDRKQIVSLLCVRFEIPDSAAQDILGSDSKSIEYAKCVWSTTRSLSQADKYEVWAAKVFGRAFAASVAPESIRPTGRIQPDFIDSALEELNSVQAIVAKIKDLLSSDSRTNVGVAEKTLRKIIARFNDTKDHDGAVEFESMLPLEIVEAMSEPYAVNGDTHGLGRSSLLSKTVKDELFKACEITDSKTDRVWIRDVAMSVCKWVGNDPVVGSVHDLLKIVKESAEQLFPFIIHLSLQAEQEREQIVRSIVSESMTSHFVQTSHTTQGRCRLMLETLIYLLTQPMLQEQTRMDRLKWLDIDYNLAAKAAAYCNMPTAALYFIELATTPGSSQTTRGRSRRSSVDVSAMTMPSNELLLEIYKSVDDPDSFYGVQQAPSLQSVMNRVDHERDGLKGIMLHSARMDASLRRMGQTQESDSQGIVKSMGAMNLNSLTQGLIKQDRGKEHDATTTETMLDSARKLQQWDIVPPEASFSSSAMLYSVCRSMSTASSLESFKTDLSDAMRVAHREIQNSHTGASSIRSTLSALAILTEIDELIAVRSVSELNQLWDLMQSRQQGWDLGW